MNEPELYIPVGVAIQEIRALTDEELRLIGVDENVFQGVTGLFLEDGGIIIPSSDDEGNRCGTFFTKDPDDIPQYLIAGDQVWKLP